MSGESAMHDGTIVIRKAHLAWPIVAIVGGAVALIGALTLALLPPEPWAVIASLVVFGLLAIVGGAVWWAIERSRRVWLEVTNDGFVVIDRLGESEWRDDQIVSMAVRYTNHFSAGVLSSITRVFRVWVDDETIEPQAIAMVNSFKADDRDPLADLIDRVTHRLLDRFRRDVEAGRSIEGDDWILDRRGLQLTIADDDISFDEMTHAGIVYDDLCVWVDGQDDAAFKTRLESKNAHLLLLYLEERLKSRSAAPAAEPEDGRLGRILFERKASRGGVASFVAATMLFAVGVPITLVVGWMSGHTLIPALLAVASFLLAIVCALGAWNAQVAFFRCHEWGVHQRSLFRDHAIRYRDVGSFTYQAIRLFVNGVYSGTTITLVFKPDEAIDKKPIRYQVQARNADVELDRLRDRISFVIAGRILEEIRQGGRVSWTKNLSFLPEGIEYRPAGWIGRKEAQVLLYDQIQGYNIDQGFFHLWAKGIEKSVMQEAVGEENFFPGYFALVQMSAPPENEATA